MVISVLFLWAAAAMSDQPACKEMVGGPTEGMCSGREITRTGDFTLVAMLPAPRPGPPLPQEAGRVVGRLLKARDRSNSIPSDLLAPDALASFCPEWDATCQKTFPLTAWPLPKHYSHGAPYLLSDGRIRVEWTKAGRLEFLSLITLEAGRIRKIATAPASAVIRYPGIGRLRPSGDGFFLRQ